MSATMAGGPSSPLLRSCVVEGTRPQPSHTSTLMATRDNRSALSLFRDYISPDLDNFVLQVALRHGDCVDVDEDVGPGLVDALCHALSSNHELYEPFMKIFKSPELSSYMEEAIPADVKDEIVAHYRQLGLVNGGPDPYRDAVAHYHGCHELHEETEDMVCSSPEIYDDTNASDVIGSQSDAYSEEVTMSDDDRVNAETKQPAFVEHRFLTDNAEECLDWDQEMADGRSEIMRIRRVASDSELWRWQCKCRIRVSNRFRKDLRCVLCNRSN
ncbi:hypothetical protein WOLCODRAFT_136635 [Wolfiporia cocos MD-104 SS10]|uniref:Uncharacterized protein n=1 Tax=Wolfiporia cocos (strain MD-104) TaxID=742152 RepID=A0A2H3JV85_WOLCO|nr:hypothetical protein WOLCODRAFT_136635 [Wolfiporia cocos MD-104 SS10]